MNKQTKIDSKKIQNILSNLKTARINNKSSVLGEALNSCNYHELNELSRKVPQMYKGLFSLSYLIRKDYSSLYKTQIQPTSSVIDYWGKVAYVLIQHSTSINNYIVLQNKVDEHFIKGEYDKAKAIIKSINETISYSFWSISYLIKIDRLQNGQKHAIELHNYYYKLNTNFYYHKFCNASIYTSSLDYLSDVGRKLYLREDNDFLVGINNIIRSHFLLYEGINEGEWMCFDMNSSIIDLYNHFITCVPNLSTNTYQSEEFRFYLEEITKAITDPFLLRIYGLINKGEGELAKNKTTERTDIIKLYYSNNFCNTIIKSDLYLQNNPLDTDVILMNLKSILSCNNDFSQQVQDDSPLILQIRYHLYEFLSHTENKDYHLLKLKGICQSAFQIREIRHLYTLLTSFEKKDLQNQFINCWKYSNYNNIYDSVFYSCPSDRKQYIKSTLADKSLVELIFESKKCTTLDCVELSIGNQDVELITKQLITANKEGHIPGYMKDSVCSHIFSFLANKSQSIDAVNFFVSEHINNKNINIYVNKLHIKEIIGQNDKLIGAIPLSLAIFYFLTNAEIDSTYLAYKNFLKSRGVNKASEIQVEGNSIVDYFLSHVATPKVITLHVLRFKTVEQVMEERIKICSNLYAYYQKKRYADEIAGIVRDLRILELNNKVNDNKIYVDIQSIKDTELEEAKTLYFLYQQSSGNESLLHDDISQLVENLKELGIEVSVLIGGYEKSTEKLNYRLDVLTRMFICVRNQFLLSPKSGLDNYLSTRIRHGTLVNQLRNHFESDNLISNKKNGCYSYNDYWISRMFNLRNEDALRCAQRFIDFSQKIDTLILTVKDAYVQVSTEELTSKANACFNFDISFFTQEIKNLQLRTELNSYDAIISEMINLLWFRTDICLEDMRTKLSLVESDFLQELQSLEKDITDVVGKHNQRWVNFHDAVVNCENNVQNDIKIVNRWFNRSSSVDFSFNMIQVVETSSGFINRNNLSTLNISTNCSSKTEIKGKYFSTIYDMFHDIFNNVLYYELENHVGGICTVNIQESDGYIHIQVKNPIDLNNEKELIKKADSINRNLDTYLRGGHTRGEGNSGCIKIFNAVHNHLGSHENKYKNSVEQGEFNVFIDLEIKPLAI